ncbi:hypothetical protein CfE428DRAFT_6668 [Chthoniobacter flavus Ellin428]|uniref:Uncharacterized protein n=1 Tax=Chthoniobacter flavus Ellin428 TaxID=497964 RepID=B4DCM7_9BACT|nr:hypothetical protein CfE428DRAFT_6668 [Chthoniobacter flavus Ellin428]
MAHGGQCAQWRPTVHKADDKRGNAQERIPPYKKRDGARYFAGMISMSSGSGCPLVSGRKSSTTKPSRKTTLM